MNLYVIAETLEPVSTRFAGDARSSDSNFEQRVVPTHTFQVSSYKLIDHAAWKDFIFIIIHLRCKSDLKP